MWDDIEWDPHHVPMVKLALHIAQVVFAFVVFVLEIIVFKADKAEVNSKNGWTFGVVFLSIPAWIYLAMAPRFPRTRKLAEPHVMVVIDAIWTVFWLSAFSTQAAYNSADQCGKACSQSKAIVGLAFFVFLLFCGSTFISIYTLKYYQFNNRLPGYESIQINKQNIDPDKAAFSMAPHDEESYAPVRMNEHDDDQHSDNNDGPEGSTYNMPRYDQRYPSSNYGGSSAYGGSASHVGSMGGRSDNPFDTPFEDTAYHGQPQGLSTQISSNTLYQAPSAHDAYDDDRPAQFPAANYDRTLH